MVIYLCVNRDGNKISCSTIGIFYATEVDIYGLQNILLKDVMGWGMHMDPSGLIDKGTNSKN